jgi:hypothetical protein
MMENTEEFCPKWSIPYDDGSTGIEIEDVSTGASITEPFDPTLVRVSPRPMTVDLLLRRIAQDALDLSPGFQRKGGIWTKEAQSRLIESLLVRIPVPAIYLDATDEDRWLVVDGLQRLTALKRFVITEELELCGLEFLTQLDGATYSDLPLRFRRRILETQVFVYTIEEGTPSNVKFNIFKRINTGGLPLSAQEIRHALNQGKATDLLGHLAVSEEFLTATAHGISDKRMADQECVLRFMAFTLTPYTDYKVGDLDRFLNEAMADINKMSDEQLVALEYQFLQAMVAACEIFGNDAFRKRYDRDHGRYPINKALFEAWSVNLGMLSGDQTLVLKQGSEVLIDRFIALMNTPGFNDAVSQGTGDIRKVDIRFRGIGQIIQEVLNDNAR